MSKAKVIYIHPGKSGTKIQLEPVGATYGLAGFYCTDDPEQVYVYISDYDPHGPDYPELYSGPRPVRIEFWEGYDIPNKVNLTKRQATELIGLLAKAVAAVGDEK